MPSSNERALEKAKTIACDGLILDLEDAVAPDAKAGCPRGGGRAAVASGDYGRRTVTIRVNGLGTEWHDDDIVAASQAGPAAIVVPKVDSADEVAAAGHRDGEGRCTRPHPALGDGRDPRRDPRRLAIARASERLGASSSAPTTWSRSCTPSTSRARADPAQPHTALLAGRAAGIAVIDGVYNDVKDTEGFLAECEQGRQMGFDGKTLIHPGQVEGANAAFAPSEQAVEDARGLIAALEDGQGRGRGDLQRQDGGEPPRRVRPSHAADPRGDQGARPD